MKKDELPVEMRSMSADEQSRYLAGKQAERDKVNGEIEDLAARRSRFIRETMAKEKDAAPRDAFDAAVVDALREEARTKHISYGQEAE